jgi:hypothetical protein
MHENRSMRLTVPTVLLVCSAAVACDSDTQIAPEQARVEDSVLAREVLSAKGEDFKPVVEETVREDSASLAARAKAVAALRPVATPKRTVVRESPRPVTVASVTKPAPTRTPTKRSTVVASVERPVSRARIGTLPRGSQLSLAVDRHVCNDELRVGQTFHANVAAAVSGSNGIAIPQGAQAVAKITSVSEWGSGIGVTVRSVRIDGKNYSLESPVAYVLPEKRKGDGVCIPQRTRIDVVTGQRLTLG